MTSLQRNHRGTIRRNAGALQRSDYPRAIVKRVPKRLGALYEISKLLTQFVETVEQAVLTLLAIITAELPLRSVILIETTADKPKSIVWHSPGISAADLRAAEARAMNSYNFLTRSTALPVKAIEASTIILTPSQTADAASAGAKRGKFITCPLITQGHPIFGALHLEGVSPFVEDDVEFISAIANQLAIALDRYHSRLQEIALRKEAEREIENRRRVEEEVRKLNEDLERRVAERTAQFQDTIRDLDAFTYSIAHDLRAPLRHIHGFSRLLLRGATDEACRNYAQRIMAATEGMDVLIRDLLAYSRLTLEEVECEPVSLSSVLAQIRTSMEVELREAKTHLDIKEPLPRVVGHEISLTQAISNLIGNSIKFTKPGVAPRISVRAEVKGDWVRLWVEDNGIGIASEHQDRIFGVFQRLHKVEDYPGTGIGLAIVRRAMERMKGRAGVESQPGQGSRFWLELMKAEGE